MVTHICPVFVVHGWRIKGCCPGTALHWNAITEFLKCETDDACWIIFPACIFNSPALDYGPKLDVYTDLHTQAKREH